MKHLNTICRSVAVASCALLASGTPASAAENGAGQEQTIDAIRAYLTTSWRNAGIARQDWDDCTQQAFLRILQRLEQEELPAAMRSATSPERRELNRCVWATVQKWRRAHRKGLNHDADVADSQAEERIETMEKMRELKEIIHDGRSGLSRRQLHILNASLDGHSVADISGQLNIPASRVSDEKYKAVRKLRQRLGA